MSSTAPAHFIADIARLNDALAPWLIEGVGFSPDAPAELVRCYARLTSTGYANGWIG